MNINADPHLFEYLLDNKLQMGLKFKYKGEDKWCAHSTQSSNMSIRMISSNSYGRQAWYNNGWNSMIFFISCEVNKQESRKVN